MKTIRSVFAAFKKKLASLYNANEVEAIALMVLTEISNSSKAIIKAFPERELSSAQAEKVSDVLTQLQTGKPIQYILGYTEFYGLKFMVDPAVLIPRPETEELVDWALTSVSNGQLAVDHILDVGTGSGCIAISLKKNLPGANVSAIDISSQALSTAKKNAELNEAAVNFVEADILNAHSLTNQSIFTNHYSLIISNPPYVTMNDKKQMHTNVTDFEPHTALFVPENDPLIFYKAIADFAIKNLTPNGLLFFEINESYGKEIVKLLKHKQFKNIELRKDMSDRYRMVKATR